MVLLLTSMRCTLGLITMLLMYRVFYEQQLKLPGNPSLLNQGLSVPDRFLTKIGNCKTLWLDPGNNPFFIQDALHPYMGDHRGVGHSHQGNMIKGHGIRLILTAACSP